MSTEEDAQVEELRRKREERRRLHEEEEKREAEERQRKEEERKQRKLERERKAKDREEANKKELEEKVKRDQKEEERRKRREERERQRQEEERKEREEEERKQKEREEKKRLLEEQEEEERRKRREQEALRRSQEDFSHPDRGDEARPDSRRRHRIDKLLNIIKSNQSQIAIEKIIVDEDMKEEATKLLTENNDVVTEFFGKEDIIMTILKYISTVNTEPQNLTDDQLDDIMTRMDFAKEAISGGIPSLWRIILQPENRNYLEELFSLLQHDLPVLPPINVSNFRKSIEFLLYRRSFEVSSFMLSHKHIIVPSFFKHLRDSNTMDMLYNFILKESESTPAFKEFDPKTTSPSESLYWTDDIPAAIVTYVGRVDEDSEWSDVEIDNIATFSNNILEKLANCKLAHQIRDPSLCNSLVSHIFTTFPVETNNSHDMNGSREGEINGVHSGSFRRSHSHKRKSIEMGKASRGGEGGASHKTLYKHQSTLSSLLSYLTTLLKCCINTSSYTTDTLPPLVSCLLYGTGGKSNPSENAPVHILRNWLLNKTPEFEFPIEHLKKNAKHTFGVFRVRCLQLFKALFTANFQCVDIVLRDIGVLHACVDLFFQYVDNNIIHSLVEDIIRMFIMREISSLEADPDMQMTQYLLDDCNLVEKIVLTLRTITVNKNQFNSFHPTKINFDEPAPKNGKSPPVAPEKDTPFLPPSFVGHVLNICKVITHASEKSVKARQIVASCSGYHWGQTVLFHLSMRDSADMEWKKPFQKISAEPPNPNGKVSGD